MVDQHPYFSNLKRPQPTRNPIKHISALVIGAIMTGCSTMDLLWPKETPIAPPPVEPPVQESVVDPAQTYNEITEPSQFVTIEDAWFKIYVQASLLTSDERKARLLALNALIEQPNHDPNHLALEQATLLAVHEAPRKHWLLAQKTLKKLSNLDPESDAYLYREWLHAELKLRLAKTAQISKLRRQSAYQRKQVKELKSQISNLNEKIKGLHSQIEALTNIEENLTEKKGN